MKPPTEYIHGRYVIRTMIQGKMFKARALLDGRVIRKANDHFVEVEGRTLEATVAAMQAALDQRDAEREAGRLQSVPEEERYAAAFRLLQEKITPRHWLMLNGWYDADDRIMTMKQIAKVAGYSSYSMASKMMGSLGKELATEFNYQPGLRADGSEIWTMALATGVDTTEQEDDKHWRWMMRPEVAACVLKHKRISPVVASGNPVI
jgi:hypothetical protein